MKGIVFTLAKGIAAGFCLFASACASMAPRAIETEVRYEQGGPRPPAPAVVLLIENPRDVRESYAYPSVPVVQQAFYWKGDAAEWRFKLPVRGFSYAGFRFLKPHNLRDQLDQYTLLFKLEPAIMGPYLWIGLVDGDDQLPNRMTELAMAPYVSSRRGKIEVRIPLRDFPETAIPTHQEGPPVEALAEEPFDWNDVRGIRIFFPGGRLPDREVSITGLRFER